MERFSFKGECGVDECTCIEALKEELSWVIDKRLRIIINTMLFKTVITLRILRIKPFKI